MNEGAEYLENDGELATYTPRGNTTSMSATPATVTVDVKSDTQASASASAVPARATRFSLIERLFFLVVLFPPSLLALAFGATSSTKRRQLLPMWPLPLCMLWFIAIVVFPLVLSNVIQPSTNTMLVGLVCIQLAVTSIVTFVSAWCVRRATMQLTRTNSAGCFLDVTLPSPVYSCSSLTSWLTNVVHLVLVTSLAVNTWSSGEASIAPYYTVPSFTKVAADDPTDSGRYLHVASMGIVGIVYMLCAAKLVIAIGATPLKRMKISHATRPLHAVFEALSPFVVWALLRPCGMLDNDAVRSEQWWSTNGPYTALGLIFHSLAVLLVGVAPAPDHHHSGVTRVLTLAVAAMASLLRQSWVLALVIVVMWFTTLTCDIVLRNRGGASTTLHGRPSQSCLVNLIRRTLLRHVALEHRYHQAAFRWQLASITVLAVGAAIEQVVVASAYVWLTVVYGLQLCLLVATLLAADSRCDAVPEPVDAPESSTPAQSPLRNSTQFAPLPHPVQPGSLPFGGTPVSKTTTPVRMSLLPVSGSPTDPMDQPAERSVVNTAGADSGTSPLASLHRRPLGDSTSAKRQGPLSLHEPAAQDQPVNPIQLFAQGITASFDKPRAYIADGDGNDSHSPQSRAESPKTEPSVRPPRPATKATSGISAILRDTNLPPSGASPTRAAAVCQTNETNKQHGDEARGQQAADKRSTGMEVDPPTPPSVPQGVCASGTDPFDDLSPSPLQHLQSATSSVQGSPLSSHPADVRSSTPVCSGPIDDESERNDSDSCELLPMAAPPTNVPPAAQQSSAETKGAEVGESHFWTIDDDEDKRCYAKGGYHPTTVGEAFNSRYKAVAKLGWGEYSVVWLAEDTRPSARPSRTGSGAGNPLGTATSNASRYVAMKISKADSDFRRAAQVELDILRAVSAKVTSQKKVTVALKAANVVQLKDSFAHRGPNGDHLVLVCEALGPNLLSLVSSHNYSGINKLIVKTITKQLLNGLSFLHEDVGIVHADLKPENVLLQLPSAKVIAEVNRVTKDASPYTEADIDRSKNILGGNLKELGIDVPLEGAAGSEANKSSPAGSERSRCAEQLAAHYKVKVSDFGTARWTHKRYPVCALQTREYRAPEVVLGFEKIGPPADIWSLACMVYELLTGDFLFDPKSNATANKDEFHLALYMQMLGPLPASVVSEGTLSKQFFSADARFLGTTMKPSSLEVMFLHHYHWSAEDARLCADFLQSALAYEPGRRATARKLMKHPWLVIN